MSLKPETIEAIGKLWESANSFYYDKKGINPMPFELGAKSIIQHPEILALEGYHKTEWVSVDDKLPGYMDCVIICTEYGIITEAQHDGSGFFITGPYTYKNVTHWMTLPSAPNQNIQP